MKNWCFKNDNDKLIELVLKGKKTATSYLFNETDMPVIGEDSILHFDNEKEACVIRTIDFKILKVNEITEEQARLEYGENGSIERWKINHSDFSEDSTIVFETFNVVRNLVEERLELGRNLATKNITLIGDIETIFEINAGFNNTLFDVNNRFVIKVCTNKELEDTFKVEHDFYSSNENNSFIPKLYKYDDSKIDSEYVYEILEKVEGKTLYYYWYKMTEVERENTIENLMKIIKEFHKVKAEPYDWQNKIENDVKSVVLECRDLFDEKDFEMILKSINNYKNFLFDNRFAFIHNDLHFDNIIYNDGKMTIIDFNDAMNAPIDFEFRQLYMCQEKPWKWANTEMDPLQKPEDYKHIWEYVKKYYEELNDIQNLEQRMIIYRIWNDAGHLKKYRSKELIDGIVEKSKLISM